jgi:tRNA (guanine-N7-)-methyltransferase
MLLSGREELQIVSRVINAANDSIQVIPASYFEPLVIDAIFDRAAPLEVDVGCGDGSFLVEVARRFPERNFLGIERLLGRVRKTCRKAARLALDNVRVLRLEASYAVRYMLPPESVSVFHVGFPDPWPKRRHHQRRLINDAFLDTVRAALRPGGELRVSTDDAPYFEHIRRVVSQRADFAETPWPDNPNYPKTDFEKQFTGLPIHRLRLRKV